MESIWSQTCQIPPKDSLKGNIQTQAAIIGGGMAGVLIAHYLKKAGLDTVILEAKHTAGGQSRNTTAKITSQHGLIYHQLSRTIGEEQARIYAQANQQAVENYARLIQDEYIDCDFERRDAYLYSSDKKLLTDELAACQALGLPATLEELLPLPFTSAGAVKFSGQAQFHPLKFIRALAKDLTIYEHTPALAVEDNVIHTPNGKVEAEQIIFACHFPFVNFPGMYFARMHQERVYFLALKNAPHYDGMFIGADENSFSLRNYGDLLFFGGASHRTGDNKEGGRYELLRQKAKYYFPESSEVAHWSAQDCLSVDNVPYIGHFSHNRPNWYVATGFQKWGMSTSMVSAMIISDLISGEENPYASVFDPHRFQSEALGQMMQNSKEALKGLSRRFFYIPTELAAEIPCDHGGVVLLDGEKVGVYKDENGKIYPVDIRCPHLGCELEYNPDEHSWDCPCHGSRFDRYGHWLDAPATGDLGHE